MKLKTRIENGFILHKSSEDLFWLFNFKNNNINNFQYENVKKLFWAINDFDKKSKIRPQFKINEKLINVNLYDTPYANYSYIANFFTKQELYDLIEDLLEMSQTNNKYMFIQIKALKQNWDMEI